MNKIIQRLLKETSDFTGERNEDNLKYIQSQLKIAYYQGKIDGMNDMLEQFKRSMK